MIISFKNLKFLLLSAILLGVTACSEDEITDNPKPTTKVPTIIFDTDLGNSTDDLIALQALFYYQAEGKCKLKAVMHNRPQDKSRDLIDRVMHFYKADDVPLGVLAGNENFFEIIPYYELADSIKPDGKPLLEPTGIPLSDRLPAWKLYRKLLSEAEDNSISIVSVGMLTNLGLLLDSPADDFSPLTGKELVAKKASTLEVMGGCFSPVPLRYADESGKFRFLEVEYNISGDVPLAKKVIEDWPGEIRIFPLEEGLKFPSIHNEVLLQYSWQKDNPIYLVYERYDEWAKGDVGQYMWDVLTVIHAILDENYFSCSNNGIISINEKGTTTFKLDENGNAHIISLNTTSVSKMWEILDNISKYHP